MPNHEPVAPLAFRPEAAGEYLGVSRSKIYELIATGELTARKIGGCTLIARADLDRWFGCQPEADIAGRADRAS